jgi:hypothetical protein
LATFEGTNPEFKRYIGPRLRNVVNIITKKQRNEVGACEHCGSADSLESAHVRGRDRTEIIDLLLGPSGTGDRLVVDLEAFEAKFKSEHEPFEKAILVLCHDCHRKYDSASTEAQAPDSGGVLAPRAAVTSAPQHSAPGLLPITLDPPQVGDFKDQLLVRRIAKITTFYEDGRTEERPWLASKFSETSDVFGNLRSRAEFRQGEWQRRGIVKAHVRVLGDA